MKKVIKIKIYPNSTQKDLINNTLGCCNWIKNKYLEINIKRYEENKSFISAYDFSKYINHLKKTNLDYYWIKQYSSKAIQDAMQQKEKAYKRFFKKNGGFPKFKSRRKMNKESFFFIKDNVKYIKKNIIQLPILGRVRITDNKSLPDIKSITGGRVIREYNNYYIILTYSCNTKQQETTDLELGIDVGLKAYATIATNMIGSQSIKHFKELETYTRCEKRIVKLQRIKSKKAEINYNRLLHEYLDKHNGEMPKEKTKKIMKGESYNSSQIRRVQRKINSLKKKQRNIRLDFINKLVYSLTARTKPHMITLENLDISEMTKHDGTKDKTLHKYIQESGFYTFKIKMISKCEEYGIILRLADKYFASSKICCKCGNKKKHLTLNDRVYHCKSCGNTIDRDLNAAINLLNLKNSKCLIYDFA